MNKGCFVIINLIMLILVAIPLELVSNTAEAAGPGPSLQFTEYRADVLDLNNDELIDLVRIVYLLETSKESEGANVEVYAENGHLSVSQWDNSTVNKSNPETRAIDIDAWSQGEYHIWLKLYSPTTGQMLANIDLGKFYLSMAMLEPQLSITMLNSLDLQTGDDCKVATAFSDQVGLRYDVMGEVQLSGTPWLVEYDSGFFDCNDWPAGDYELDLFYRNDLGYILNSNLSFTIKNRDAPQFTLNITGNLDDMGSFCEVVVNPINKNDDFSDFKYEWSIVPERELGNVSEIDCTFWEPGVHRIILTITDNMNIRATQGYNLVRLPPIGGNSTFIANETEMSAWPTRSSGVVDSGIMGYGITSVSLIIFFLLSVIILKRFGNKTAKEEEFEGPPDADGLPTFLDDEGHQWRRHPDGQVDWWDSKIGQWVPFQ